MPAEFVKEYNEEQKRNAWKEGIEEGIEKGEIKGRTEGIKEGRTEAMFNVAKALIKENIPLKTIIKTTNLSKEDIESLK